MASSAVPVLPVADLVRSIAWYERLGFEVRVTFDGYAILAFDGAELHLGEVEAPPPGASVSGAYLRVDDADAVFAHWSAMGIRVIVPPEDQAYGIREFATEDLDGNLWRVGSPLGGALTTPTDPTGDALDHHRWIDPESDLDPEPEPGPEPVLGGYGSDSATIPPKNGETGREPHDETVLGGQASDSATIPPKNGGALDWYALVASGEPCPECGWPREELPVRALGAQVRDEVHAFGELLAAADDDAVRAFPADGGWTALEYGVHTRDVLNLFAERIVRMLAETEPELPAWDQEAAMADGMANESYVAAVVDDLGRNAAKLSESLRMVTDEGWERGATRHGGQRVTIELMARFALHEAVHHREDARRRLEVS